MSPTPFVWRDVTFTPEPGEPGCYRSARVPMGDHRSCDWKVSKAGSTWYARLRVGSDRFPGRGDTAEAALDSAAAEASLILRFLRVMLARTKGKALKAPRKAVRR